MIRVARGVDRMVILRFGVQGHLYRLVESAVIDGADVRYGQIVWFNGQ